MNIIFDLDGVIRGIKNTPIKEILNKDQLQQFPQNYRQCGLCDFVAKYLPLPSFKDWDKGLVSADQVLNSILEVADEPKEIVKILFMAPLKKEYNFVFKETLDFVKTCKKLGHKVFILSNMSKEIVDILPSLFDLSLFDGLVFSCDIGLRKPDKKFYKIALNKMKINARDSVFIDDSEKNLIPFQEIGGWTYLFKNKEINKCINDLENFIKNL